MSQDTGKETNVSDSRETWLRKAVEIFRPRFAEVGYPLPQPRPELDDDGKETGKMIGGVRISIGFGPQGARKENAKILGVCLAAECTPDLVNEIFISPEDADTASMLATVVHELCHAATNNNRNDPKHGAHEGAFAEIATRLGLTGAMTATMAGPELAFELLTIAAALGPYPGALVDMKGALDRLPQGAPVPVGGGRGKGLSSGGPTQTTRMLKMICVDVDCPAVGYMVRTTAKWLEYGAPLCPMGHEMAHGAPHGA